MIVYPLADIQQFGTALVGKALKCAEEILDNEEIPAKEKITAGNMVVNVLRYIDNRIAIESLDGDEMEDDL